MVVVKLNVFFKTKKVKGHYPHRSFTLILVFIKQFCCCFMNVLIHTSPYLNICFRNEWLGGAVLDVYEKEPIPPESPIWDLPGVFITPHVSGWSNDESVSHTLFSNAQNCTTVEHIREKTGVRISMQTFQLANT